MDRPENYEPCCPEFEKALESGTDNEAYGCLLKWYGNDWHIGADLQPVLFCPWCGMSVGGGLAT